MGACGAHRAFRNEGSVNEEFPGLSCHIGSQVGSGSNAIADRGWCEDRCQVVERHEALIKERFEP